MNPLDALISAAAARALGWALLHFLWQGAVVAALLAGALAVLRRPAHRYLVCCGALALLPALVAGTFLYLRSAPPRALESGAATAAAQVTAAAPASPVAGAAVGRLAGPSAPSDSGPAAALERARAALEPLLPALVGLWLAGVGLFSLRGLGGWAWSRRLLRRHLAPAAEGWQARLARLAEALRLARPVRLCESALVEVPTVVGWLKPVILAPASCFAGLAPEQLEAILAHELAHVRRHDVLVGLGQSVVESLLFYHPAVWWISGRVRTEREHCCDDLAVAISGDALAYARGLAELETLRRPRLALAVAADGAAGRGALLARVRRLLGVEAARPAPLAAWSATAVGVVGLLAALGAAPRSDAGMVGPQLSSPLVAPFPASVASFTAGEEAASGGSDSGSSRGGGAAATTSSGEGRAADDQPTGSAAGAGRRPSVDDLIRLRSAGVTEDFIDGLARAGYSGLSVDDLLRLRQQGVDGEFIGELRAAGYAGLSVDELVRLRQQGVDGEFIGGLAPAGLGKLAIEDLVRLRQQGVDGELVGELKGSGYADLSVDELVHLRQQGVDADFIGELKAAGYADIPLDTLVRLRQQGVDGEFIRGLAEGGLTKLPVDELVRLRQQGVDGEFVAGLARQGLGGLPAAQLVRLRQQGVDPDWVEGLSRAGYPNLAVEQLIRLRQQGVDGDFIAALGRAGYSKLSVEDLIRLRQLGVDPGDLAADGH